MGEFRIKVLDSSSREVKRDTGFVPNTITATGLCRIGKLPFRSTIGIDILLPSWPGIVYLNSIYSDYAYAIRNVGFSYFILSINADPIYLYETPILDEVVNYDIPVTTAEVVVSTSDPNADGYLDLHAEKEFGSSATITRIGISDLPIGGSEIDGPDVMLAISDLAAPGIYVNSGETMQFTYRITFK